MNILNYKKNIKIKISKTQILNIKYGLFLMKIFPFIKIYLKNVNELYIQCLPTNLHNLIRLATFLKLHTNSQYKCLSDICAVDYPDKRYRFEVVYNLVSLQYNTRINLTIFIQDSFPLYSLTQLYNSANWLEREVWDMFGIYFYNHHDLRRLLTDYGFKGHPLRKDFPLSGYTEILYNDFFKKINAKEVALAQAYRNFSN